MTIIAKIETPKQRCTVPLAVILRKNQNGTYSTHEMNAASGAEMYGHYEMTLESAWEDFKIRANKLMSYGVGTFERESI